MFSQFSAGQIRSFLIATWCVVLAFQQEPIQLFTQHAAFALLGVMGAVFANATGAGGGVVFVPFFNQMGFSPVATVATSFAIQCFGMTAGAMTWWRFHVAQSGDDVQTIEYFDETSGQLCGESNTHDKRATETLHITQWQSLYPVLLLSIPASIVGLLIAQFNPNWFGVLAQGDKLHIGFGVFSILLAISMFLMVTMAGRSTLKLRLRPLDSILLPIICICGGVITAYLSIGVGELVAVYLIMRGFNVTFSIACAVILSAVTVWSGVVHHVLMTHAIYWPVVLFAGPGAVVGGILAKRLVLHFSPTHLKLFFASWILVLGVSGLVF
ncbi:sulfite exporter TauE/SafE family protein [Paraglaciecola sp. T6c]|uniref:sulfite exporter TauE/SafE family protein n=1 Tax=Pseudoalteromonas atlantica (strain T6c / ATCC BAA-1087) TaxID=3042615 RepID=UPI0002ED2D1D|nr:sulfite exporter TauE/SafE family protein [Paraglaciecola sp. T6c]